jgi:hypothetical protein
MALACFIVPILVDARKQAFSGTSGEERRGKTEKTKNALASRRPHLSLQLKNYW